MAAYPFLSFLVCLLILVLLLRTKLGSLALDQPNHRSLHSGVIPRTGGLAIMSGVLVAWVLLEMPWVWLLLVLALVATSLIDDIRGLSIKWRFLVQLGVASVFSLYFLPHSIWWLLPLVAFAIVWMSNLYNFMDGSDGLAGGMALFGFGAYAIAAYSGNDVEFFVMSACIASAAFAFLLFNFYPAKIFMGDAGSVPLGFLAGAMGLYGWQQDLWPLWFPILVFSPFIADASVTLLRRLLGAEKIWEAHHSHYYQRLVRMGWGHQRTAIAEYALMLAVAVLGLLSLNEPLEIVASLLVFWILSYGIIMRVIDQQWRKFLGKMSNASQG